MRKLNIIIVTFVLGLVGWFWWKDSFTQDAEKKPKDSLHRATSAYNSGRYKDAEKAAERIIEKASKSSDPALKKEAVRARYVMAFAAARQNDMKLARERFAALRVEAAKLPDKGKMPVQPGQMPLPTLEEDAAYQHAVCIDKLI